MDYRPYQQDAANALDRDRRDGFRAVACVMATGLGKTFLAAEYSRPFPRTLFLAHTNELVEQAREEFANVRDCPVGIEQAEFSTNSRRMPPVIVGTIQSVSQPHRLDRLDPTLFDIVYIDECHRCKGKQYGAIRDHFLSGGRSFIVGLTATPSVPMRGFFQKISYSLPLVDAVRLGWLVEPVQIQIDVDSLDFSAIPSRINQAGDLDFDPVGLESVLTAERPLHEVAFAITQKKPGKSIVFCSGKSHAERLSDVINRYDPGSSVVAHSGMPKDSRRFAIESFRRGDAQYLCGVGIFVEGFNCPDIAAGIYARPFLSVGAYEQAIGRIIRTLPDTLDGCPDDVAERLARIASSPKPKAYALDFSGNAGRHKLVNIPELWLSQLAVLPLKREVARTLFDGSSDLVDGPAEDVAERIRRAELAHLLSELAQEQEQFRRHRLSATRGTIRESIVSPFSGDGMAHKQKGKSHGGDPATGKQVGYLVYLGIRREKAAGFSKKQAAAVITKMVKRKAQQEIA